MGTLQVGDSFDAAITFLKKRDGIDKVCSRTAPCTAAGREEGQAFQIQPDGFARNRTCPVSDRCHHHLQVLPLLAWGENLWCASAGCSQQTQREWPCRS